MPTSTAFCTLGVRGLLDPPVLDAPVQPVVQPRSPRALAARAHPRGSDRTHGIRLLHRRAHAREVPRSVLSLSAQKVRGRNKKKYVNQLGL